MAGPYHVGAGYVWGVWPDSPLRVGVIMRRVLLLALLGLAPPLAAQATPEDAARAYGAAVFSGDWAGTARLMHPSALRQLRDLVSPAVADPGAVGLLQQLFGVGSAAEFAATPDTILFARLLKSALGQNPEVAAVMSDAQVIPLGHITVQGDTTFVVTRLVLGAEHGITITKFDVMPFIQDQGRWWGLLNADITNLTAVLTRMAGQRQM